MEGPLILSLRVEASADDLLDAAEDLGDLLDHIDERDVSPAFRAVLAGLDDAITSAATSRADA